jgi:hypothetical protein
MRLPLRRSRAKPDRARNDGHEADRVHEDKMTIRIRRCAAAAALAFGASFAFVALEATAAEPGEGRPRAGTQQQFETPEAAVKALVEALGSGETKRIHSVLGPGSGKLIRSGDPVADRLGRERFVAAFEKQSRIETVAEEKATLLIGEKEWPFPFPLLRQAGGWRFDVGAGAEEVLNRRIGRNELSAIQVCLAYVDAQREFALGGGKGLHEYAVKFVSEPGRRDGLYWPTGEGEPPSPLGPLLAKSRSEGYAGDRNDFGEPYHGYHYRILTAQGANARGGAYDYVVGGKMIGGFALVAYPARWAASGVMTFVVNHDGVVYQKNLGRGTVAIASRMARFDPDATWSKAPQ